MSGANFFKDNNFFHTLQNLQKTSKVALLWLKSTKISPIYSKILKNLSYDQSETHKLNSNPKVLFCTKVDSKMAPKSSFVGKIGY